MFVVPGVSAVIVMPTDIEASLCFSVDSDLLRYAGSYRRALTYIALGTALL